MEQERQFLTLLRHRLVVRRIERLLPLLFDADEDHETRG
jgi:hypothetical protein